MPYLMGAPFVTNIDTTADVAAALDNLSWSLPATGPTSPPSSGCVCPLTSQSSGVMGGNAGNSYDVTIHLAGQAEHRTYTGGTNDGFYWQVGGDPTVDTGNVYALTISSPAQKYYVNRGLAFPTVVDTISYYKTIQIDAGATVTLSANSIDGQQAGLLGQSMTMTVTNVVKR